MVSYRGKSSFQLGISGRRHRRRAAVREAAARGRAGRPGWAAGCCVSLRVVSWGSHSLFRPSFQIFLQTYAKKSSYATTSPKNFSRGASNVCCQVSTASATWYSPHHHLASVADVEATVGRGVETLSVHCLLIHARAGYLPA